MSHEETATIDDRSELLRGALCRIQLAACELGRLAGTPRGEGLVMRITRAVDDLDRVLSTGDPRAAAPAFSDLGQAVCEIFDRLGPAVSARGLAWLAPELPAAPLFGDAVRMKRLAIAMLIAVSGGSAAGEGSLRLRLEGCTREVILHLDFQTEEASETSPGCGALMTLLRGTERFEETREPFGRRWTLIVPGQGPELHAGPHVVAGIQP